jgi:IS605 OrfB family transposase
LNKTVKQYSKKVDKLTVDELKSKAIKTAHLMNYIYTRFHGIKSYYLINNNTSLYLATYLMCSILKKDVCSQFGMQTRSIHGAIFDAVINLKVMWINAISSIKGVLKESKFNDHEKHYIHTVLKYKEIFFCVINKRCLKNFEFKSEKQKDFLLGRQSLSYEDVDYVKINRWIRKQIRKFKYKPIVKNARQFHVANFKQEGNVLAIEGLKPRDRPEIKLTDSRKLNPSRIVLKDNRVEIHSACNVKISKPEVDNIIGVDKGFRSLIASSSGNLYGEEFNDIVVKKVNSYTEKCKKRNKLRDLLKKLENQGEIKKSSNIRINNLGDKKFVETSRKSTEHTKNFINKGLNNLFKEEKPSEIVCEDLTKLEVRKGKGFSRKVNNYLNKWQKGYLQERLVFKTIQHGSGLIVVNSAYTSQICSNCNVLGKRNAGKFSCPSCEIAEVDADVNAAKNILARKYDSEIKLWMYPKTVKGILFSRISGKLDPVHYPWTPKTLDTDVGDIGLLDYTVTQRANKNSVYSYLGIDHE